MNEELQIAKLSIEDLDNVLALQEKNIKHFKPEERHFTVHRTREDFVKALTADNQYMYGVYIGNTLVAQSMLEFPKDGYATDVSEFTKGYRNSDVAIYRAVLVDPDYRGMGLMMRMLQAREDMAIMCGKKLAVCKVSADNSFSWQNILKHGMQIMNVYEENGHTKLFMQKHISLKHNMLLNMKNKIVMKFNASDAIIANKMSAISKMGKIGVWDKEQKALAWVDYAKVTSPYTQVAAKLNLDNLKLAR